MTRLQDSIAVTVLNNFNLRFDSLNILTDGVFPALKNLKGEYKLNIEDFDELPGTGLKIASYAPIIIKK